MGQRVGHHANTWNLTNILNIDSLFIFLDWTIHTVHYTSLIWECFAPSLFVPSTHKYSLFQTLLNMELSKVGMHVSSESQQKLSEHSFQEPFCDTNLTLELHMYRKRVCLMGAINRDSTLQYENEPISVSHHLLHETPPMLVGLFCAGGSFSRWDIKTVSSPLRNSVIAAPSSLACILHHAHPFADGLWSRAALWAFDQLISSSFRCTKRFFSVADSVKHY